jgi:signal transduction histidine kinase
LQAQLIEDILDVSRIIRGKLRLHLRPINLVSVIETALDAVRPQAEAKHIELVNLVKPAIGLVSGDPDRLQQIIWNLLTNAIKFTPKKGRVEVRLVSDDSHVHIEVSDTGVGISKEFLPYIFDRFRQADSTSNKSVWRARTRISDRPSFSRTCTTALLMLIVMERIKEQHLQLSCRFYLMI